MQYFLDGPIAANDKFILTSQINGTLYVANTYTDSKGNTAIIMDSNVPSSIAGGASIPTIPTFSAVNAGNGINMSSDQTKGGNVIPLSLSTTNGKAIMGPSTILTPFQNTYVSPSEAIFLSGVPYTLNDTAGKPISFDYGSIDSKCNKSPPDYTCVTIVGDTVNVIPLPLVWFFACQGNNYTSSSTIPGAVCSAYCGLQSSSSDCTSSVSVCSNYQSHAWTKLSDCKVGVPYSYCPVGKTCGYNNCNGPCPSSGVCSVNNGTYKCTPKEVGGLPLWIWVIIGIIVLIIIIVLVIFLIKAFSKK